MSFGLIRIKSCALAAVTAAWIVVYASCHVLPLPLPVLSDPSTCQTFPPSRLRLRPFSKTTVPSLNWTGPLTSPVTGPNDVVMVFVPPCFSVCFILEDWW